MTVGLEVYSNKVCEASGKVQIYEIVVKFIVRAAEFRKVIAIETSEL